MIDRVAFTIFGKEIYWYGIIMTLAILVGYLMTRYMFKRKKMDPEQATDMALLIVPLAIICSRAHYVIWSWNEFAGRPFWHVFAMWEGGMAIYGGLIGGLAAVLIFSCWKKINFGTLIDCLAPGMALGQAIGRWGNFMNQEVYGRVITDASMQWFPFGVFIEATGNWHYALFFYESCLNLISFAVLLFVISRRSKTSGVTGCWYVVIYGVIRGILEPFRETTFIQNVNGIPVNQLFAIGIALIGLAGIILLPILAKKKAAKAATQVIPADEGDSPVEEDPTADDETAAEEASEAAEEEPKADEAEQTEATREPAAEEPVETEALEVEENHEA